MQAEVVDGRAMRSRATRSGLLEAAREIITERGVDALTMTNVADAAGVSRRTAYLHFQSRGDIVLALFDHLGESSGLGESIARVWEADDAPDAVLRWARHVASAHAQIMHVSRAVERVRAEEPAAERVWATAMTRWRAGAERLVLMVQREGRLLPHWSVERATDAVWSLMSFELIERLAVDCDWSDEQVADMLDTCLVALLMGGEQHG